MLKRQGRHKGFWYRLQKVVAVDNVDFEFYQGELISIVGESGSGKTTLAKMLLDLIPVTEGQIYSRCSSGYKTHKKKKEYWRGIQAIFQDPFSAYNIFTKIDTCSLDCIHMRRKEASSKRRLS